MRWGWRRTMTLWSVLILSRAGTKARRDWEGMPWASGVERGRGEAAAIARGVAARRRVRIEMRTNDEVFMAVFVGGGGRRGDGKGYFTLKQASPSAEQEPPPLGLATGIGGYFVSNKRGPNAA